MSLLARLSQTAAALWILNVWFNRFDKDTGYRGGGAKNMKEEFGVYGLSETQMYAVGAMKVGLAGTMLVGHVVPRVVRPASVGLAAFMAAQRTKEIGVRKVLGASSAQIARLLVWQFSKPVAFALAIALPAAFFASNIYLNFFAERIESPILVLVVAGAVAVMLAWGTVAGPAVRIARANPVLALRYE